MKLTHQDLKEIDADPVKVVAHKASQLGENVIVEDTSLDIEGASVGINIRWLLDHLPDYAGRRAVWTVLLGYHQGNQIAIYRGVITGTIVAPRGLLDLVLTLFFCRMEQKKRWRNPNPMHLTPGQKRWRHCSEGKSGLCIPQLNHGKVPGNIQSSSQNIVHLALL